jgi:hypothetical protein
MTLEQIIKIKSLQAEIAETRMVLSTFMQEVHAAIGRMEADLRTATFWCDHRHEDGTPAQVDGGECGICGQKVKVS